MSTPVYFLVWCVAQRLDVLTLLLLQVDTPEGTPLDIAQTSVKMYGEDTRASRMKVHAGLSYLKQKGRVRRLERGKWVFVK
jgi:hypothetical protein